MCFFIVHIECTCPSIPSSRHELQSMPVCVHTFPHTRVLDARLSFILLLTCCLLVCLFACFVCLLVFCVRVCFCCCLACCLPPCPAHTSYRRTTFLLTFLLTCCCLLAYYAVHTVQARCQEQAPTNDKEQKRNYRLL